MVFEIHEKIENPNEHSFKTKTKKSSGMFSQKNQSAHEHILSLWVGNCWEKEKKRGSKSDRRRARRIGVFKYMHICVRSHRDYDCWSWRIIINQIKRSGRSAFLLSVISEKLLFRLGKAEYWKRLQEKSLRPSSKPFPFFSLFFFSFLFYWNSGCRTTARKFTLSMPCVEALPRTLPRNAVRITVGCYENKINSSFVPCHIHTRHEFTHEPPKGIDCTIVGVLWFASLDGQSSLPHMAVRALSFTDGKSWWLHWEWKYRLEHDVELGASVSLSVPWTW